MLSERLVYFRKKNKLTQNDVAYRLNVVRSTYTNWEAGRSEPDVSTLIKLSDIYNVSLDNLVGFIHNQLTLSCCFYFKTVNSGFKWRINQLTI
ncbi:helix-turn-helix transcriptional regulator [Bacillus thuringiensis]|uniref:helix-turn-helix domain-containing protein n=1 Tax=Bacillus thuringiensis TaxID=1428 RepID=UPI003D517B4E